jgi:hypothetical protein
MYVYTRPPLFLDSDFFRGGNHLTCEEGTHTALCNYKVMSVIVMS